MSQASKEQADDDLGGTGAGTATQAAAVRTPESPAFRARRAASEPDRTGTDLQPPVRWREILAVALMVVLADLAIYRGHGFAGYAAIFAAAPLLLLFGVPRLTLRAASWIAGTMLLRKPQKSGPAECCNILRASAQPSRDDRI